MEPSPARYVEHLVEIFREVRRVLRNGGTVWVVIGDSFVSNKSIGGCKPKDLIGIPWLFAFAMRDDGWYLRQDIVWYKGNTMPSSVKDRPTSAYEHVFLFSKQPKYFYDYMAVSEPVSATGRSSGNKARKIADGENRSRLNTHMGSSIPYTDQTGLRRQRNVWSIPTKAYRGAHFAVFPVALAELCIKAGTPAGGVCRRCSESFSQRIRRISGSESPPSYRCSHFDSGKTAAHQLGRAQKGERGEEIPTGVWNPTCGCQQSSRPAVVLDPFCGSGAAGVAALNLGRRFIGIDLSPEYIQLARRRLTERR